MKEYERYRLVCRWLSPATGLASGEMVAELSGVDWPQILRVAGDNFVTTLLAGTLREKGLFEQLPEDIQHYLESIRQLNLERNEILKNELLSIIARLNEIGVQPLLLKGVISLVSEQYPGCGDRVIGDLDLAVPGERIEECFHLLARKPYRAYMEFGQEYEVGSHHHAPPLLHEHLPVTLELHRYVLSERTKGLLPTDDVWRTSVLYDQHGLSYRLPGPTSRLMHTFVHTQIQDNSHLLFRLILRPLCEFVNQRVSFDGEIDWDLFKQRLGPKQLWKLETYLLATQELFGQPPPEEVPIGLRAKLRMPLVQAYINTLDPNQNRHMSGRLRRLPFRLMTPDWYPIKFKALMRGDPL